MRSGKREKGREQRRGIVCEEDPKRETSIIAFRGEVCLLSMKPRFDCAFVLDKSAIEHCCGMGQGARRLDEVEPRRACLKTVSRITRTQIGQASGHQIRTYISGNKLPRFGLYSAHARGVSVLGLGWWRERPVMAKNPSMQRHGKHIDIHTYPTSLTPPLA